MGYPELIILDEPTVGLDPKQIKEIRELIRELSKEHTIILSSHIMQEVNAVCDSILIIDKGRLILQDKPENLGKHFSSTVGVKLVVKGDKDTIISELRKIDSITKLEETRALEEGTVGLTVYSNEDKDIREDLFFSLSGIRTPILEMQSISMSLEDIFLKVTQEEESVNETSTSSEEEVITDVSDL